ncbi:MAG TPA: hypothetical protein VIM02_09150 [Rhizomicrobium sp.]|jgi:hypothetical protein
MALTVNTGNNKNCVAFYPIDYIVWKSTHDGTPPGAENGRIRFRILPDEFDRIPERAEKFHSEAFALSFIPIASFENLDAGLRPQSDAANHL